MTDYFTLQTQIASIMDVLSKTAVAEICKLVDDGSVMLRLEMCRRENEIKELNRKLNLMEIELRVAREKNSAPVEIHVVNQLRAKESGPADSNPETTKTPPFQHQHLEEVCNFNRTITELSETQHIQPLPTASREGHTVPPEAGRSTEQLSGFQCVVKAEREEDHAAKRLHLASEQIPETTGNLGSEGVMYESQLQTYFEDTDRDGENSDPSGSCDAEPYMLSVHAELQPIPRAVGGACYTLSLGQSHGQASSTVPVKEEFEMQTSCSEESRPEGAHTQQGLYDERLEREDLALQYRRQQTPHSGSVSSAASKLETRDMEGFAQSSNESERAWNHKNGTGMKRFICTHCGKSFDRFSHLERHQRIHTGEKPYSCATCGKCFSQKSSLKGHQRVHTGERPYSCNKCRKTFSSLSNRNAHQYHHTSVRAYSCYVCGKSYCHLSTLKVHQRIHTEGNLL